MPALTRVLAAFCAAIALSSCARAKYAPESRSVPELIADLSRADDHLVRAAAAHRLGLLAGKSAVPALLVALGDSIPDVRIVAIESLGAIGDPAAVEPLCGILTRTTEGRPLRAAAIQALGRLRDERAIRLLLAARHDTARDAAAALLGFGEVAIPSLTAALDDAGPRNLATEVLATLGSPAVEPLAAVLDRGTNRFARLAAARALAEIDDPRAGAALARALRSEDAELAAAAYRFLVREGRPGSEPLLVRALYECGRISMAEEFARSGNPRLRDAADAWAKKQDAVLSRAGAGSRALRWGHKPEPLAPLALFHFDSSLASASGALPAQSGKTSLVAGKWGAALSVGEGGLLSYPGGGNLDLRSGTVEMWVAPRFDGTDPVYSKRNHALLLYRSPAGEEFLLSEGTWLGFYGGSVVGGTFHGAGGGNISRWKAGEWHHVALTYTAGGQRIYVDGAPVAQRNGAMPAPRPGGQFTVGSDPYGNASAFHIDELRISSDEKSPEEIRYDSGLRRPFESRERFRPLDAGI